jgi:hypothetical protein
LGLRDEAADGCEEEAAEAAGLCIGPFGWGGGALADDDEEEAAEIGCAAPTDEEPLFADDPYAYMLKWADENICATLLTYMRLLLPLLEPLSAGWGEGADRLLMGLLWN